MEDKIQSMTLEDEERPKARLSGSSSDLAVAARLASAEAIASALTEAATSAANGELDGSEAGKTGPCFLASCMRLSSETFLISFVVY